MTESYFKSVRPVITNAFSVDVEDYFHVSAFESIVDKDDWESIPSRVVGSTTRILELLSLHDVNATFFVLGWVAEKYPDLVRTISDAGHEVACHGYSHQRINCQSRKSFIEETHRAKSVLEECIGAAVIGYRAASFSITRDSLWALDILVEQGFVYDSSIYPVWHDHYGILGAERSPSRLETPLGQSIVEFPLSTCKILGMTLPVGGGGYFRMYPYWITRKLLQTICSEESPINFYCHPWELDTGQPRFERASWKSRFRHYNNIDKFERRLHMLFDDFEFTTCVNVLRNYDLLSNMDAPGA